MNSVVLHASALLATHHSPLPPHRSRASSTAFCSQTGHAGIRLTLFVSSLRFLCVRRLPRPGRGVSALSFSVSAGVLPYVYLAATSPPFPYFLTSLSPYLVFSSSRPAFCLQLGYASIGLTLFPMDFALKDHQKLIRDTVRQFMEAEVRPFVKEMEKEGKFPAEAIKKLGEMGCCGMLVPEEWGGPGLDAVSYVLMLEEVARVFTAMSTVLGVTNSAVQAPLMLFGTEAQKKKYLRRMATGETLGAFCLTEPAAGSDAAGIQARAIREGNVYKLSGTKTWVTNGSVAGVLIVFAKTDPAAGGKGISAFLVEPGFAGFRVGRHEDKMGQRSSPSVEILLNDCVVPVENRLGEEGQGLKIALSALDGGRMAEDCAQRA